MSGNEQRMTIYAFHSNLQFGDAARRSSGNCVVGRSRVHEFTELYPDTTDMRFGLLALAILSAGTAQAAVTHIPIKSKLVLGPGEAYTVTIEATEPTEIGWQAVQAKRCTTNCVQATDVTGGINYSIATPLGASMKYKPASGKISIEYKNVSGEPVTVDVFRIERTCEAEACKFLGTEQNGRWLVFKVDEFKSITTSADGSYSTIAGVTTSGRAFSVKAVWWTDDKKALGVNCAPFVTRYVDNHTPKERYRPYIISGQAVGEGSDIVLRSIDACAPKAPNFGVPEKNVFK
jgi:hypothetical protein